MKNDVVVRCRNRSLAAINATLQLLVIYKIGNKKEIYIDVKTDKDEYVKLIILYIYIYIYL